jgi:hypothetical protein
MRFTYADVCWRMLTYADVCARGVCQKDPPLYMHPPTTIYPPPPRHTHELHTQMCTHEHTHTKTLEMKKLSGSKFVLVPTLLRRRSLILRKAIRFAASRAPFDPALRCRGRGFGVLFPRVPRLNFEYAVGSSVTSRLTPHFPRAVPCISVDSRIKLRKNSDIVGLASDVPCCVELTLAFRTASCLGF